MTDRAEAELLVARLVGAAFRQGTLEHHPGPSNATLTKADDAVRDARAAVLAAMTPPTGYNLVPRDTLQDWMDVCDRLVKSRGARLADLENVSEEIRAMLAEAPEVPK